MLLTENTEATEIFVVKNLCFYLWIWAHGKYGKNGNDSFWKKLSKNIKSIT